MALTTRWVTQAGAGAADGTSEANAMSAATFIDYITAAGSVNAAPGDVFNVIGNLNAFTATSHTLAPVGTATSPIVIRGVVSGGASAYAGRTSGNGPLITTNFPQWSYTTGRLTMAAFWVIENINFSSVNTGNAVSLAADSVLKSCVVANSSTGASAVAVGSTTRGTVIDCDVSLTGASGGQVAILSTFASSVVDSCRVTVTSSTAVGIQCQSSAVLIFNTIYGCGGVGISMNGTSGTPYIRSNTIVGCAGNGINIITGATVLQRIVGNMLTDNGGYGIDGVSAANAIFAAYNRTRDNTSGATNLATDWISATCYAHVTTDTGGASTDYTASGSGDYSLIAASPATSAGLPGYASIGALQRSQTGGSTAVTRAWASIG